MKLFEEGIFSWKKTVFLTFAVNVLLMVFVWINLAKLPPQVPLYYGNVEGAEQLGPVSGLFIPPGFCLVFLLMNSIITKSYKDDFLSSLLVWSSVILTILSTITVLKIMMLVGNL